MRRKAVILSMTILAAVLLSTGAKGSTSLNNANALRLYMYRGQVQGYVGYPDSVSYNANYRRNLEFYATADGYDVSQIFVGYMSNGQLGILGHVFRPGRTNTAILSNQLRARGLNQISSNYNSVLFQGNDSRTGRVIYAIVEDQTASGLGPVLTLLTVEVYQGSM